MGILAKYRESSYNRIKKSRALGLYYGEIKNIINKKPIFKNCVLTQSEKEEIDEYFTKYYGKKISYKWHQLYKSYTGMFDVRYFPEILYSTKLEPKLNPFDIAYPLGDKSFVEVICKSVRDKEIVAPKAIILNSRGVYFDSDRKILSLDGVIDRLKDIGEIIIKPTIETMGGKGVRVCNINNNIDSILGADISEILKNYGENFIIQNRIINHDTYSNLYDKSINTVRVITYNSGNKIKVAPLSMRIGMNDRIVDNGGIYIGLSESGTLNSVGFNKKDRTKYYEHPNTHIKFEGYRVEGIEKIISASKSLHAMLPQLKIISWDMSIDEKGRVIVIEINTTGQSIWFPQMVNGVGVFSNDTPMMLKMISGK